MAVYKRGERWHYQFHHPGFVCFQLLTMFFGWFVWTNNDRKLHKMTVMSHKNCTTNWRRCAILND